MGLLARNSLLKNFEDLGLSQPLLRALAAAEYTVATPIQQKAIPPLLAGCDLMGCAQTGTGKTAAFALPTLHRLTKDAPDYSQSSAKSTGHHHHGDSNSDQHAPPRKGPRNIRALILAPTRELAAQIQQSFALYGRYLSLRVLVIHGGVSQGPQVKALQRGVDIVVATPGRLLDLMNQGFVNLRHVEVLILDEADQMFDMGFFPDLKRIIARVPVERQTMMFSATMPDEIRQMANQWLYQPEHIEVARVSSASAQVTQSVYHVMPPNKSRLLVSYIKSNPVTRSLVFTRTKHGADQLVKVLMQNGIDAVAIHGNKSQNARTRNLQQFKSDRPPVLVATDIAARGIDVDGVSHVFNYQLPEVPEVYVHRIGRTGRADATGIAVSFCSPEEMGNLRAIEGLVKTKIAVGESFDNLTYVPQQNTQASANRSGRPSSSRGRSNSTNDRSPRNSKPSNRRKTRRRSSSNLIHN